MIQYVLFDLDDTLYPAGAGLMNAISARITDYVAQQAGVTREAADALRLKYYRQFGSSVRPLVEHHQLNLTEFLTFAHAVDVEGQLTPDLDLDCLLECVQTPKAIFTNGPRAYAERVLRALGIAHQFTHVFDYEFGAYLGKPNPTVYAKVQDSLQVAGDALMMVDDAAQNLTPARALGWKTICVAANQAGLAPDVADFVVHDLWQVADAFRHFGVMDEAHHAIAEHRLAGCAWARKANVP